MNFLRWDVLSTQISQSEPFMVNADFREHTVLARRTEYEGGPERIEICGICSSELKRLVRHESCGIPWACRYEQLVQRPVRCRPVCYCKIKWTDAIRRVKLLLATSWLGEHLSASFRLDGSAPLETRLYCTISSLLLLSLPVAFTVFGIVAVLRNKAMCDGKIIKTLPSLWRVSVARADYMHILSHVISLFALTISTPLKP